MGNFASTPSHAGCSEGGTSIEDLAEKFPEKIIKIPIDIRVGITDAQVWTGLAGGLRTRAGRSWVRECRPAVGLHASRAVSSATALWSCWTKLAKVRLPSKCHPDRCPLRSSVLLPPPHRPCRWWRGCV